MILMIVGEILKLLRKEKMINTLLYYKTYILDKQILSPRKNLEVRTAFIKLIEPFLSDYKSVKTYNWISLYLLKLRKPWMHYICLFHIYSFTRIPLISMSIFKNPKPKKYLTKKIQGYILIIIFIICKLL